MEVNDDNKLVPKWCSFRQHGDALHIGAYDPTREGYQYFSVHEDGGYSANGVLLDYGMTLYDAATGEELLHRANTDDTGRGVMANVGAGGYFQFWGAGTYMAKGNGEYETTSINGASSNFRIFYDGDLYDELMDGQEGRPLSITSWNGSSMTSIFSTEGCVSVNGTKSNPSLQADILGDWREEIVMARSDNEALRVFVSDIPTDYKIMTLMHDSVYRSGVAAEQTAYNQPTHIGFYIDETYFSGPITELKITKQPDKTEYFVGETLNTAGMELSIVYENGKEVPVKGYSVSGYDSYAGGEQKLTVTYGGNSTELIITVNTGFKLNTEGVITGYESVGENTAILPDSIDGIAVTGFADGSMKTSDLKDLYIYNNDLTFTGDVFGDSITVHAYDESSAKEYCTEHGVTFASLKVGQSYMANENYDEGFDSFVDNFIVMQWLVEVEKSINGITYGNNPRTGVNAYPDYTTGIKAGKTGDNVYLVPVAGEFSTANRNAWLEIDDKMELANVSEYTFKFDIMYPTDCGTLVLTFSDGEKNIDSVEMTEGMSTDTWYTYTYHYDADKNLTRTISQGANVIDEKDLGEASGTYAINTINFTRNPDGINPSTLWGAWENHGLGLCALAYMDNIQVFTPELSAARFVVTDAYGCPIEGAEVTMDGTTVLTDENGIAQITREHGEYTAQITANGYKSKSVDISLLEGVEELTVQLEYEDKEITEFAFEKTDVTIPVGHADYVPYTLLPVSLDNGVTFESSNTAVASVDTNGVITAKSEGKAVIKAVKNGIETKCNVTVISADTEIVPSKIVLSGADEVSENLFGSGSEIVVTAEVYDADGARIYDTPVSFTCSDDSAKIYDNAIIINGGKGDVSITATCDGAYAEKTIKTKEADYTEYASSDFSNDVKLLQGTVAQSYKLDGTGITLNVGNRAGSGDSYTGFVIENGVLKGQAGQFNTINRNAYITFDDPPSLNESNECMFTTKLKFTSKNEVSVAISGSNGAITTLTPSTSGFEIGVEYIYELLYSDGSFTQTVTNTSTGEVVSTPVYSSATDITRIDITSDGSYAAVEFDDMRIISAEKIMSRVTVCVYDENGDPVPGAAVTSDRETVETAANGRAVISCYSGANTFTVSYDGKTAVKTADIAEQNELVDIKLAGADISLVEGDAPIYFVKNIDNVEFIKAKYSGDVLTNIENIEKTLPYGCNLIELPADSGEYKVFVWDEMKPLTNAYTNN